jgi:Carboxypeptidase regulatory-like domain
VSARMFSFAVLLVLLAACGQESVPPGGGPIDDPNATVTNRPPGPSGYGSVDPSTGPGPGRAINGTAAGVVLDRSGQPVVGALVEPKSLDEPAKPIPELAVVTDAQGRYEWHLQPGRYELVARMGDRSSSAAPVVVTPGETAQADLTVG